MSIIGYYICILFGGMLIQSFFGLNWWISQLIIGIIFLIFFEINHHKKMKTINNRFSEGFLKQIEKNDKQINEWLKTDKNFAQNYKRAYDTIFN